MKFQKLLIPALALGLFTAIPAIHAQDEKAPATEAKPEHKEKGPRGGRMSPEQRIAQIDQAVGGLTDDQKAKIKDILTKTGEQMKEAAPEDRRALMKATQEQIRGVLTAEQQPKFDAMRPGGGEHKKKKAE